ncbi:MAG: AAA family ATPase [Nitrospinae bacterium]|nr:AAA family ATPase [Nitrospinota bacterium]
MIKTLKIKNFKSIKHLKLDCKKINLFIGKPNSGKSNILESVGIFSFPHPFSGNLKNFIRFENMTNLFYDQDTSEKIEITADDIGCEIEFKNGHFIGMGGDKEKKILHFDFDFNYDGQGSSNMSEVSPFKGYRFTIMDKFQIQAYDFLLPPKGENLLSILLTNKTLRKFVAEILNEYGLRIVLKPQDSKIEVQKEIEDVIISYPYSLVSDTLQRIIFYLVAIETNKGSTLIFEEPEAHAFPFYTKFLAESIAMDKSNQYFISTHNPYLLLSILEKAPKNDIGVFIVYFKNYQTKIRTLSIEQMAEIFDLDSSIFFNLDRFLEEE